jgi:hypothetical protein
VKILKTTFLFTAILIMSQNLIIAQNSDVQMYAVHEDRVKPSMAKEAERIDKELVDLLKKHNIQEANWMTVQKNDHTRLYLSPINSMADLDKDMFATLSNKIGKDAMNKLFSQYNKCYDEHGDYVINLRKDLSYMPGGMTLTTEGQPYRRFYYNYVTPENVANMTNTFKKIKETFVKHNAGLHYRIYTPGFGTIGNYFMVAISAKNEEELTKAETAMWEKMSVDMQPLFDELDKYSSKVDMQTGWMRDDLSYAPKK